MAEKRRRSLRTRITAAATLVVAVALVFGALAFWGILSVSVRDAAVRAAETRAEQLATRVDAEGPAAVAELDDDVVQVLDDTGAVVARSDEAESGDLPNTEGLITYDDEPMLVVREDLDDGTLLLGVSVEDDQSTLATVAGLLAVAVAGVVALVAAITWWVVGRALRPVAHIRAEVDDITADRLDRRVAVPRSGDEIAALAGTMNRMLDRLDAAATAQRRFVSDASHELRSPLATIRQHAELAQLHPEATSVGDLAEVVHDEGLRMQELVDALLLLTRLDEQPMLRRESVDLDDVALAEVARLRAGGAVVDGSGIHAARVQGDPRLLGQLVRNLADNAVRHAREAVAIGVVEREGRVLLTVDDDGDGIPPGERERVFERFVRLDEGRARDAGGSGLGLAIVRAIAEAEGGAVWIEDSPLSGARFSVALPAAS
ncbi:HAMP domain-containing sensor histidine kinase [Microbacterium sp. M3]|uniref:histidine kinase n=1 Tax=Microbacterium arthrosphaerae TaxID=792652 RepID=A0ABU4H3T9_9MICO|nr:MULTISPECIES: HAMP domain-containing sensor histidine kinase [Microbacterium]MDW4573996.1 HAMP domain-containing sensor histidine kinase [Microbacterium arthrosphaerae]MDW7607851.1 HAMP domain-containing sensor histidine kinase [Microbacterium sp. M3]